MAWHGMAFARHGSVGCVMHSKTERCASASREPNGLSSTTPRPSGVKERDADGLSVQSVYWKKLAAWGKVLAAFNLFLFFNDPTNRAVVAKGGALHCIRQTCHSTATKVECRRQARKWEPTKSVDV